MLPETTIAPTGVYYVTVDIGKNVHWYAAYAGARLEAAKGLQTASQIASQREVHPNQISAWKKQLLTDGPTLFSNRNHQQQKAQTARETELYEQLGRLTMELAWLKKKANR